MDSGNGNNQQQRYCPTPIMAPPSVATSPPGIGGGNVMGSMHQAPHHPPPSISPHPASAYYTHHSAGGGHYPTPSPTPPPPPSIHHQQYYAHQQHPYYAHGSHQQAQQTQSHQSHHGMSSGHVGMSAPAPGATPQGQHPHLMSHGSYHHPSQPQSHHQQWAAPSHTHQQQSHHYYHQPAHHTPPQQQPQQQGYPPPPHSPYPYSQAHSAAPTPPPQQQQQQQQLPPPPVPASPGPSQMHQPAQQSQSHALINLSRFVSQQSTSPSPRASPSLPHPHHQQQISQMGPHSPAPFGGHMDHHTMNGHSGSMGPSSTPPVMSPPPPMGHGQQTMSPPPGMPMQQHHLPPQSPNPYNVNGGGSVMDRHSPTKVPSISPDMVPHDADFREFEAHKNKVIKEREQDMRNMFPELSPGLCTKDNEDVNNISAGVNNEPPPVSSASVNSNSNNNPDLTSIMSSNNSESSFPSSSPVRRDSIDSCNTTPQPDIPRPNGSGTEATPPKDSNSVDWEHSRSSVSPQAKSMGSPTNAGNGHQMMPVRLQNMQKGARTKASMKKLMQEQQITTPNGQASDISSDGVGGNGKDGDGDLELEMDSVEVSPKGKGKSAKAPRKKKSQNAAVAAPEPTPLTVNQLSEIIPDLSENDVTASTEQVPRPGYTKAGKKIGRPRKDPLPASAARGKGKKGTPKGKSKKKGQNATPEVVEAEPEVEPLIVPPPEADPSEESMQLEVDRENQSGRKGSPKRRGTKGSRKRSSKVLSDASDLQERSDLSSLASPDLNQLQSTDPATDENTLNPVTPVSKGGKRAKTSPKSITPPEPAILESIPTSKITEQTAKSVAGNYQAPVVATGRSRKRGKKVEEPEPIPEDNSVVTQVSKKGSRKKTSASPVKEVDLPQEHGDLPRLRSRSPKQTDSPPLRLSSPRAAKERSTTPAKNTASQRSSRASRSREKDPVAPVTTPLASPATRSPKKVPENKGSRSRPTKTKPAPNESQELQNEYLSPPPVKRTRQISKESSESGEVSRRSRKGIVEARASVDSDRSLSSVGKRASRRKSGSVSGSTDRDSIASPSFNQSGSSQSILPPGEVSLETPSEVVPASANKNKRPKKKKTSYPVKRGKGKAAQAKSRKALAKSAKNVVVAIIEEPQVHADENGIVVEPEGNALPEGSESEPTLLTPTPKTKKQKKPYVKKGRKSSLTTPAPVAPVEEHPETVPEVPVPDSKVTLPVKPAGKKKSTKKSKQNVSSEESLAVLSIPEPLPAPTPTKKKSRKTKLENKKPKQAKKSSKKKPELPNEKDPYHFDSSDFTATGSSASVATDEDSKVGTGFVFSPPQALTLGRRRRSSAMSPVNTQTSAKSGAGAGTESSPTKVKSEEESVAATSTSRGNKPLRRDSRSLSREFNDLNQVSVVLSDIARSPEFSNLNRLSPSVPDYLLPPPEEPIASVATPKPEATAPYSSPESASASTSLAFIGKSEDPPEPLPAKGKKQAKVPKKRSSIDLGGVKKQPKKKSSSKSLSHKMEMEERKKQLEVEVAQIILNLSSGASSKGSSPAKSIPSMDAGEAPPPPPRSSKSGRRRKSTSPRLSVDNTNSLKQEDPVPSIEVEEVDQSSPSVVVPGTKKRKSVKSRRSSQKSTSSKKSSTAPGLASLMTESYSTSTPPNSGLAAQSLPFPSPTLPGPSIKVAKTAVIPTASSLGLPEPLPSPIVAPTDKKGKVKKEKTAKNRKAVIASPDITEITATSTPKPKRKRSVKKEVKLEQSSDQNQPESTMLKVEETSGEPGTKMEALPAKKKRQRKPKVPPTKTSTDGAQPSTSAAAIMAMPSTSKLFPYQTEPTPYKKPTVVARSVSGLQLGNKADDNQKNKGKDKDGPSVRVLGGIAKFYRGGEEEEVDPDPKLPKQEKGQLPTDNAVPWICSFCHLGPHAQKLGDLFGPYFADLPAIYGTSPKRETWVHGDCSLWAGRLILVGTYLRRLEETLVNADKETCTICNRTGATVGCLKRGCKEAVHYPCAIRKFWKMDEQNFHSYCPKHSS